MGISTRFIEVFWLSEVFAFTLIQSLPILLLLFFFVFLPC